MRNLRKITAVKMSDIELSRLFRQTRKACKSDDEEFKRASLKIFNRLVDLNKNRQWAEAVGEIIPRIFARDINTGYDLFHDEKVMQQLWDLYSTATPLIVENLDIQKWSGQKASKCKIIVITSVFWDDIAPSRAVCDFARSLDPEIFETVIICTNQFFTHKRRIGAEVPGENNTLLGHQMKQIGIPVISLEPCESNTHLAELLIEKCQELEPDIIVSNASPFGFPDACLASSGIAGAFFDMHQGFPMYADNIDAICHFVPETKETQLSLWERQGGKVLSYDFGIPVSDKVPEKHDNGDKVYLITVSNHLTDRLSEEFCNLVSEVMLEYQNVHYTLVGKSTEEILKAKFPSKLHSRIECVGAINDENQIAGWLLCSDIYLNEFPVGGGRALLESMAMQLPIIAMRCGERHVENIATSFVGDEAILEYSSEKYRECLIKLIEDKEYRHKTGQKLRKRLEDVYDIRITVKKLGEEIYELYQKKCLRQIN